MHFGSNSNFHILVSVFIFMSGDTLYRFFYTDSVAMYGILNNSKTVPQCIPPLLWLFFSTIVDSYPGCTAQLLTLVPPLIQWLPLWYNCASFGDDAPFTTVPTSMIVCPSNDGSNDHGSTQYGTSAAALLMMVPALMIVHPSIKWQLPLMPATLTLAPSILLPPFLMVPHLMIICLSNDGSTDDGIPLDNHIPFNKGTF